jgi:hypothetical protein
MGDNREHSPALPARWDAGDELPADLRALRGPGDGATRWEALAARIDAAAAPELARRAAARASGGTGTPVRDLAPLLARALRPALAAAAAAALVVGTGLTRGGSDAAADDAGTAGQLVSAAEVAEALRVGDDEAAWLARGAAPSREALARAVGLGEDAGADRGAEEARP